MFSRGVLSVVAIYGSVSDRGVALQLGRGGGRRPRFLGGRPRLGENPTKVQKAVWSFLSEPLPSVETSEFRAVDLLTTPVDVWVQISEDDWGYEKTYLVWADLKEDYALDALASDFPDLTGEQLKIFTRRIPDALLQSLAAKKTSVLSLFDKGVKWEKMSKYFEIDVQEVARESKRTEDDTITFLVQRNVPIETMIPTVECLETAVGFCMSKPARQACLQEMAKRVQSTEDRYLAALCNNRYVAENCDPALLLRKFPAEKVLEMFGSCSSPFKTLLQFSKGKMCWNKERTVALTGEYWAWHTFRQFVEFCKNPDNEDQFPLTLHYLAEENLQRRVPGWAKKTRISKEFWAEDLVEGVRELLNLVADGK